MSGKLEDYLVKEFVYHVYKKSKHELFGYVNYGKSGEQSVDIALKTNVRKSKSKICALIESKHFRNISRDSLESKKVDERTPSLKSFKKQLGMVYHLKYGWLPLKLSSKNKYIYGLPFASYVSKKKNDSKKETFYKELRKEAKKYKLAYYDSKSPYFKNAFEDCVVRIGDHKFYVSLRVGLWRKLP